MPGFCTPRFLARYHGRFVKNAETSEKVYEPSAEELVKYIRTHAKDRGTLTQNAQPLNANVTRYTASLQPLSGKKLVATGETEVEALVQLIMKLRALGFGPATPILYMSKYRKKQAG
jgi:hypothetical protein